jgi:hypothetical protein
MAFERGQHDADGWDLSAPSSQVLLTGAATPNIWAIKLALKELVLRRALVLQRERRRRFLILSADVDVLSLGRWPDRGTERPLLGVMEAFPKSTLVHKGLSGTPIDVAAREITRWYRAGGGYVQAEVLPALEWRGYYRRIQQQDGQHWQLTEAGERRLEELRALLETGRLQLPAWVQNERELARDYVQAAGSAPLLLGNPSIWLWGAMAVVLAGETLDADAIPVDAGLPFPPLTGQELSEPGRLEASIETGGQTWGEGPPDQGSAGGSGGFDSPGERIDAAIESDGDDGGGDGE